MSWWSRPALREPSAAERGVLLAERCQACHDTTAAMERRDVPGLDGPVWLCVDSVACRRRAQDAGIYLATGGR